jgi:ABC-type glycerol-3-phosphate transport system substrate-binding protein
MAEVDFRSLSRGTPRLLSRRAYLGAGFAGAAISLASCGGGAAETQDFSKLPAKSVPLTLWGRNTNDTRGFDLIRPLVEERYPHLAITSEPVANLNDKLVVTLAGGGAPDLAVVNMPFAVPMFAQGAAMNLQTYIARDRRVQEELKQFSAPALKAYRYKNDQHAIPITNSTNVVFFNEDLIRNAGAVPPHEFENDAQKWNWRTMLDIARKVNRGQGQDREVFGLHIPMGLPALQGGWGDLIYSNDGRVLSDDGTKAVLSQPAAMNAMQYVVDHIWQHELGPYPETLATSNAVALFTTGRLALLMGNDSVRKQFFGPLRPQGLSFKLNLAQVPFSPTTGTRHFCWHGLALPTMQPTKVPDAAWQYLTVFVTEAAQRQIPSGFSSSRAAHQKTYDTFLSSNADGGPPANWGTIVRSDPTGISYPSSPYMVWDLLTEPLTRLLPQIFGKAVSVRDGLEQVDREINAMLEPAVRAAPAGSKR